MLNNKKLIKPLRIAVSGKSGCGNTTASRLLAEQLGINFINYTFRNLAHDKGLSFEEIRRLAETDDAIDRELDRHQIALAMQSSCVLASRLAVWMLKEADLKVYLDISLAERARRIHCRENGTFEDKLEETMRRDQLDHDRYQRIYHIDNDSFASAANVIINDDTLSADEIASLIISKIPTAYFE
jgi:cytidylate kinase